MRQPTFPKHNTLKTNSKLNMPTVTMVTSTSIKLPAVMLGIKAADTSVTTSVQISIPQDFMNMFTGDPEYTPVDSQGCYKSLFVTIYINLWLAFVFF